MKERKRWLDWVVGGVIFAVIFFVIILLVPKEEIAIYQNDTTMFDTNCLNKCTSECSASSDSDMEYDECRDSCDKGCRIFGNMTLPDGSIVWVTYEEVPKLNNTFNLFIDLMSYININDKNLSYQLKMVKNGTADRIIDPVLQEKVEALHDYLTENLTANEIYKFRLDGVLQMVYDIDDVLNTKNVTMINIRGKDE